MLLYIYHIISLHIDECMQGFPNSSKGLREGENFTGGFLQSRENISNSEFDDVIFFKAKKSFL